MLSVKRRLFVEFYLGQANGNATEAAKLAGYAQPQVLGRRLLTAPAIRALIDQRVETVAMAADEVLTRLAE